jgi:hypothetical protein
MQRNVYLVLCKNFTSLIPRVLLMIHCISHFTATFALIICNIFHTRSYIYKRNLFIPDRAREGWKGGWISTPGWYSRMLSSPQREETETHNFEYLADEKTTKAKKPLRKKPRYYHAPIPPKIQEKILQHEAIPRFSDDMMYRPPGTPSLKRLSRYAQNNPHHILRKYDGSGYRRYASKERQPFKLFEPPMPIVSRHSRTGKEPFHSKYIHMAKTAASIRMRFYLIPNALLNYMQNLRVNLTPKLLSFIRKQAAVERDVPYDADVFDTSEIIPNPVGIAWTPPSELWVWYAIQWFLLYENVLARKYPNTLVLSESKTTDLETSVVSESKASKEREKRQFKPITLVVSESKASKEREKHQFKPITLDVSESKSGEIQAPPPIVFTRDEEDRFFNALKEIIQFANPEFKLPILFLEYPPDRQIVSLGSFREEYIPNWDVPIRYQSRQNLPALHSQIKRAVEATSDLDYFPNYRKKRKQIIQHNIESKTKEIKEIEKKLKAIYQKMQNVDYGTMHDVSPSIQHSQVGFATSVFTCSDF